MFVCVDAADAPVRSMACQRDSIEYARAERPGDCADGLISGATTLLRSSLVTQMRVEQYKHI